MQNANGKLLTIDLKLLGLQMHRFKYCTSYLSITTVDSNTTLFGGSESKNLVRKIDWRIDVDPVVYFYIWSTLIVPSPRHEDLISNEIQS